MPEVTPNDLRLLADICEALNAAEDAVADQQCGMSLSGVLTVGYEDANWANAVGHHAIYRIGHIENHDIAAWAFTPADPTDINDEDRWGQWCWMPWPEDTIAAVIEAARALVPPPPPSAVELSSLVVDGVERIDPVQRARRDALRAALDALDKSQYQPCARRKHIVRGDHTGKDGRDCDHRYTDATEPGGCTDPPVSGDEGAEVPGREGAPAGT